MILKAAKEIYEKFRRGRSSETALIHSCKWCGAPVTRLYLISGGIIRVSAASTVRMEIGCRDCHRSHKLKGDGVREHWLALQLNNQSRRVCA